MTRPLNAIHCLNQFFGGIGGEEHANLPPQWIPEAVGPGKLVTQVAPDLRIVGTVVFGDNFVAQHTLQAKEAVLTALRQAIETGLIPPPDLVLAGPAFLAGRYGLACGAICQMLQQQMNLPCVTAMSPDNPAAAAYRRDVTIVRTTDDVLGMRQAIEKMAEIGRKLVTGTPIDPEADGTIAHGFRVNEFAPEIGAQRALDMLLGKLRGEPFRTEYPMPQFERVPAAPPVTDLQHATLALITSGGIVPKGNPDRIPAASADRYGVYPLSGLERLSAATHQTVHGGYDPTDATADPNRVLPLDAARELQREGRIGRLYEQYFATVGNATSVRNAQEFGQQIAKRLVDVGVQAAILTST